MTRRTVTLRSTILSVLLLAGALGPAWGAGVYLYEKSATDVGLASAGWVARADDATTVFSNPAGLTRLEGSHFEVTLMPLYLQTEFDPDPALTTTTGSDGDASDWLPAGGAFYARQLSDSITFGLGLGGYFGLAMEYEDDWVGRYYIQEIQVQALTIEPAVGFRLSDRWSIGVGVAAHYGIFDQTVAINNEPILLPGAAQPDGSLNVDATDWTFQGNLGFLWEGDGTRIGLQYLSKATLDFEDTPEFTGLRPFLEAALNAAGVLDTPLNLEMEMPQAVRLGFHSQAGERWAWMGDIGWEEWSKFGKIDVLLADDNDTSITADRNYDDAWHVALGAQRTLSDSWTLDFGLGYDSSIVDDADRTPDLPLGEAVRVGIGAEYRYGEKGLIAFAYEGVLGGQLDMDVNRGVLAGRVAGEYDPVAIHFLAVTWRKNF
jgi:long-chain fatty acid transport protein